MADACASTPWLDLYTPGAPATPEAAARDKAPVRYFDRSISCKGLDGMTDARAVASIERGCAPGDRLSVGLQNQPLFLVAALAAWKAGGGVVATNPTNREHELRLMCARCRA